MDERINNSILFYAQTFQRQIYEGRAQLEVVNTQYRMLARERRTDAAQKIKQMVIETFYLTIKSLK